MFKGDIVGCWLVVGSMLEVCSGDVNWGFEGIYNQQIWYLMIIWLIIWLVQPIQGWLVVSNIAGKPSTSRLFAGWRILATEIDNSLHPFCSSTKSSRYRCISRKPEVKNIRLYYGKKMLEFTSNVVLTNKHWYWVDMHGMLLEDGEFKPPKRQVTGCWFHCFHLHCHT